MTCTALVLPSSPASKKYSTGSPSARLRKPSVWMLVCTRHTSVNQTSHKTRPKAAGDQENDQETKAKQRCYKMLYSHGRTDSRWQLINGREAGVRGLR